MPALPDDVSSVFSRYTRLAELCRESAAKARLAEVARSLRKLAANYDRRAREVLPAARPKVKPMRVKRTNRVPKLAVMETEPAARPMFRFADLKRKAGLGAHKAEHGSD
jgi:hypothetical protein